LAERGFRCYLGRKLYINYLIKNLKGYIYLDKGYHEGVSEKIHEAVKKNHGIIVSLDEEGGVDYSDGSTLLGRYSKALFDNADLTFMWGNKQYELVKNHISMKNKVTVTGHPRFELLKPEFHFLYRDEVDKIKNRFNTFILINTNMGFGNNIRGDDFVISNYGNRFKNIDQIIAFDKKKLEAYSVLLLELSQQQNKTIVLMPHPEEDHSFYLNAFKGRKNIHVVHEGSVVPWILAANLVIHPDCTTAIESLFLGKKSISYLPDEYPTDLVTHLPLEASICFTSKSELFSFLKFEANNLEDVILANHPFADKYFSMSSAATDLIVEKLHQLKESIVNKNNQNLTQVKMFFLKISAFKRNWTFKDNSDKLIETKLNGFSYDIINNIIEKIYKYNNKFNRVKCQKITNQLFLFSKK